MESQLASWKPRNPSQRLKHRLFRSQGETAEADRPEDRWSGWRWVAPALVGSMMVLVVLGPRSAHLGRLSPSVTDNSLAAITSNHNYAAYLTSGFHSEQNGPRGETLEWTFGSQSHSRMSPLPSAATNNLLH